MSLADVRLPTVTLKPAPPRANAEPHDGAGDGRRYAHFDDREPGGRGVADQAEHESEHAAENAERDGPQDSEPARERKVGHGMSNCCGRAMQPHAESVAVMRRRMAGNHRLCPVTQERRTVSTAERASGGKRSRRVRRPDAVRS